MQPVDLTACEREPIHIPGAVQPYGVLLVIDRKTHVIRQAGGACERLFGEEAHRLLGKTFGELSPDAGEVPFAACDDAPSHMGVVTTAGGQTLDVVCHLVSSQLVVELEPAPKKRMSPAEMAKKTETIAAAFGQARSISELAHVAAHHFREVTGFDRVMIYRFLRDETGAVIAESKAMELEPFLNHRYPASDIPRQARELYVKNVIRVIGDVAYEPAPLAIDDAEAEPLDMSMAHLRSVSKVHLQYLKNMGVASSSSISIVRDGKLWGLVACHHRTPRFLTLDERTLCRLLAGSLSQQIASLEEAELYKARLRARTAEDAIGGVLAREPNLDPAIESRLAGLISLVPAHGVAFRVGDRVTLSGKSPEETQVLQLADWLLERREQTTFATDSLSREYAPAAVFPEVGSGVVAITVSASERRQLFWFRAEQVEEINWAGNPHKPADEKAGALTPRASFEVWRETVRARAEPWSIIDVETATRFARQLAQLYRGARITQLNEGLRQALEERDSQLQEKDYLLREGDHRIQNSLQIVGGMLQMQLKQTDDVVVREQLEEAIGRVQAVALVHGRLHRSDEPQVVSVDAYVRELLQDLGASLGEDWKRELRVSTAPISAPTELAMSVGLVLTELVLNAVKYAYGGAAGPLEIDLHDRGGALRLLVRDFGSGEAGTVPAPTGGGLGSRLVLGLVERHNGAIERSPAGPGLRVGVTIPLVAGAA